MKTPMTTPNVRRTGNATFTSGTCTTCGCLPSDPYRRWIDGEIVEGCISAAHNGLTAAESSYSSVAWHNRPAAKLLRRECAKSGFAGKVRS